MANSRVLLEEISPHGNLKALVEEDGRVVFFYLWAGPGSYFGTRDGWVRNLVPAPPDFSNATPGQAPLLPRPFCAHPDGLPLPRKLRVVWLEEGDGAALLDDEGLLTVIPPWSGMKGFHAYARDCIAQNPVCWPLGTPAENVMHARVQKADAFFSRWLSSDPWPGIKSAMQQAWTHVLGAPVQEDDISQASWPPRAVLRFPSDGGHVISTVGMSIRRQPRVEMAMEDPREAVRIELAFSSADAALLGPMTSWLQVQSAFPWQMFTWLGDGHTIPCGAVPEMPFVLLTKDAPGAPAVQLPDADDGPVRLLWVIPITEAERELAVAQGADALRETLWRGGVTVQFKPRPPVETPGAAG